MVEFISNTEVTRIVMWVFGAGLVTGFGVFLLATGIGGALKIFKVD